MEQLLEDYKRRIATCQELISDFEESGSGGEVYSKLILKRNIYRTFISELEKAIREQTA